MSEMVLRGPELESSRRLPPWKPHGAGWREGVPGACQQGGLGWLPRPLVASLRLPYTCGTRGLGSLLQMPAPLLRARSCPLIGAEDGWQPPSTGVAAQAHAWPGGPGSGAGDVVCGTGNSLLLSPKFLKFELHFWTRSESLPLLTLQSMDVTLECEVGDG